MFGHSPTNPFQRMRDRYFASEGLQTTSLVALFFLLLTVLMLYPLSFEPATHARETGDTLLVTWILAWDTRTIFTNPLHLFDGNIFYPFPDSLAFSEAMVGSVPISAPVIWLTGNPLLAHNVVLLASFFLCCLGTYLLVRYLTNSTAAGLLAGVVFAFAPYKFDQIAHLPFLTAQWMPFALLFLHRGLSRRRWRDFLAFSACLALQALSSFYYAFFFSLAIALFVVYFGLLKRREIGADVALKFVVAGALAAALVLPFSLPYFRAQALYSFSRSLDETKDLSATFQDYFAAPPSNLLYGHITAPLTSRSKWPVEHFLFPGLLAPLLALAGVVRILGFPAGSSGASVSTEVMPIDRRFGLHIEISAMESQAYYLLLAILAFVLSLGPTLRLFGKDTGVPLPYAFLYDFVPGFTALRVPTRFDVLVMLALSVLAGYGLARILRSLARSGIARVFRTVCAAAAVGIVVAEYASIPLPIVPVDTGGSVPFVYQWLAKREPAAVVAELPSDEVQDFRYEYFSTYHWHPILNGQSGFVPPGYAEVSARINAFPGSAAIEDLRALGVRYVVVHGAVIGNARRSVIRRDTSSIPGVRLVQTFGTDDVYQLSWDHSSSLSDATISMELPSLIGRDNPSDAIIRIQNTSDHPIVQPVTEDLRGEVQWDGMGSTSTANLGLPLFIEPGSTQILGIPITPKPEVGTHELSVHVGPPLRVGNSGSVRVVKDIPTSQEADGIAAMTWGWDIPTKVPSGRPFTIRVNAKNTGSAEWLAHVPGYHGQVGLGIRGWYSEDGQLVAAADGSQLGGRAWLPVNVLPGQDVSVTLSADSPKRPGVYHLRLDLVSEFVCWFSDVHPGSDLERSIEVVP